LQKIFGDIHLVMNDQLKQILAKIRILALDEGIENVSIRTICNKLGICKDEFYAFFKDENDLAIKLLEFERESFKEIFDEYDFEEMNAIDILLIVSKEVASRYYNVTPAISRSLSQRFPEIYQEHLQKRMEFVFEKIQINLQKGIRQGMYRTDLSIELIARLYLSRMIDIHNEDIFPPNQFSFQTLFQVMFDNFVRSVATPEGLNYFETKMKNVNWY
jgi:TetR/AcrR family transcriptional regulator, cholesterol catabolism regulator